jgi:N-acetyl-anhydromuramyl-L-alanine amidase AmpD
MTTVLLLAALASSGGGQMRFPPPAVVPRAAWNAKPVLPHAKRHEIRYVTIHHTGTAQNHQVSLETKLQNLQSWSQRADKLWDGRDKPAWPDIPYHYYISTDGRIGEAREAVYVGDTNTEYDPTGHLLIVVEGSFDTEEPTEAQILSLRRMTLWAAEHYRVPGERVMGHSDYARTSCPGLNLHMEVRKLAERVRRFEP